MTDHHIHAPRTPPPKPYQQFSHLITPPTPRYAPIDEPDYFPGMASQDHKSQKLTSWHNSHSHHHDTTCSSNTSSKAADSLSVMPLTPEQTPIHRDKRVSQSSAQLQGTVLFSGFSSLNNAPIPSQRKEPSPPVRPVPTGLRREKMEVFHDTPVVSDKQHLKSSNPFAIQQQQPHGPDHRDLSQQHPYDDTQDVSSIPGMWHVFRGRKVFRPFANGMEGNLLKDYKPRVLFGVSKRDDKTLEMSTSPIIKSKRQGTKCVFDDDDNDDDGEDEILTDPFMSRFTKSTTITHANHRPRPSPSTPEIIDSDEEAETDREDLEDLPVSKTSVTTLFSNSSRLESKTNRNSVYPMFEQLDDHNVLTSLNKQ